MIYGIGTDICKIARIAQVLARHGDRFAEKILGPQEMQTYRARGDRNAPSETPRDRRAAAPRPPG